MSRPSNTDRRREQIARALLKVMASKGYDGASIAHIAAAAHLAPGIVHYHYKDKQEILVTALRDLAERHNAALDAKEARASDPAAKVLAFIDFHLGIGADADPETLACWVMISGEALRQRRVRTEYEKAMTGIVGRLESMIEDGVRKGVFELESCGASTAASALVAVIQGYFVLAAAARSVIPPGSAAEATQRMAEGLLKPRRPFASHEATP